MQYQIFVINKCVPLSTLFPINCTLPTFKRLLYTRQLCQASQEKKTEKKKPSFSRKKKSYLFSLSFNKLHFLHTSRLFLPITTVILFLFLSVNCIALLALSTWSSRNRWRKRRKEGILQQKIWNLCSLEMYSLVFYSCEFVEKEKENQVNFKKS